MPRQPDKPRTAEQPFTVAEVAAILRVSKMTVYRLVNDGTLPAFRFGRSIRINPDDLKRYLNQSNV